jgi:hypothetical protein
MSHSNIVIGDKIEKFCPIRNRTTKHLGLMKFSHHHIKQRKGIITHAKFSEESK